MFAILLKIYVNSFSSLFAMISKLTEFQKAFNNHQIRLSNRYHNKIIKEFTCYLITEKNRADDLQKLVKKSEIIMIDEIGGQNDQYFVIFIDNAIIFFHESDLFSNLFIKKERYCTIIASEKINKELLSYKLHINFSENFYEYEKKDTIRLSKNSRKVSQLAKKIK